MCSRNGRSSLNRVGIFLSIIFVALFINCSIVAAQPGDLPSDFKEAQNIDLETQPVEDKSRLPEIKTHISPSPELPEIVPPKEGESDRLSVLPAVFVRRFRLEGNRVFFDEELAVVTAPYENRKITSEELQALRRELTRYYVNKGYINSGVIIPDQAMVDGVITLRIIEGVLNKIEIHGNKYFQSQYLYNRLMLGAGPPLNIPNIQEALQLLQQDQRIRRINAELKPGIQPGESILNVRVEEESPYRLGLEANNNLSPSIGEVRREIQLAHQNLTGNGDMLDCELGFAEGLNDLDAGYTLPVSPCGTSLKLRFRKSNSTVIEDLYKDLDIKSKAKTFAFTLSHPYYRTSGREFVLSLTSELRKSETSLGGEPFSFSPGAEDGQSNVTVFRFSQDWADRSQNQVIAVRSTISKGVNAFNSTINDSGEDGRFWCWLGQIQWVRRLSLFAAQMVFRTDFQLADGPLLPLEKFAVGGMYSVRGYRENQFVRDNGIASSVELRIPVIRYRRGEGLVQLAPFWDFGRSWNARNNIQDPYSISSMGLGIRWAIIKDINLQIYKGFPLKSIETLNNDLQGQGIHFRFNALLF